MRVVSAMRVVSPMTAVSEWCETLGARCFLPGEAGYLRSDLDLWCRLHPLSQGVVPYSGDSSWDLLTSSSWEVLRAFKAGPPSTRCQTALAMACTSSRCQSWTCLTASFMAWSCFLMRALGQTFSLSLVIIRVWVCRAISMSVLSSITLQRPSVSVILLSSNSEPAGHPEVTGLAEVVMVVTTLAARSSSMVYIFRRVAGSQQKGMGYPPMWASRWRAYAMHSNFFMTLIMVWC